MFSIKKYDNDKPATRTTDRSPFDSTVRKTNSSLKPDWFWGSHKILFICKRASYAGVKATGA